MSVRAPRFVTDLPASAALIAVTCVGAVMALGVIAGTVPLALAIAVHALMSAWLALVISLRPTPDRLWAGALTIAGGPAGGAAALFALWLGTILGRAATPFAEWYARLFPEEDRLDARVPVYGPPASFLETMRGGTRAEKFTALSAMQAHWRPAFAPALRAALDDSEPAIRVQAAATIAALDARWSAAADALRAEMQRKGATPERVIKLATILRDGAASGLLDAGRTMRMQAEALSLFLDAVGTPAPNGIRARCGAAAILLAGGHAESAEKLLPPEAAGDREAAELRAEALFALGRHGALRRHLAEAQRNHGRGFAAIAAPWSGAAADAQAVA